MNFQFRKAGDGEIPLKIKTLSATEIERLCRHWAERGNDRDGGVTPGMPWFLWTRLVTEMWPRIDATMHRGVRAAAPAATNMWCAICERAIAKGEAFAGGGDGSKSGAEGRYAHLACYRAGIAKIEASVTPEDALVSEIELAELARARECARRDRDSPPWERRHFGPWTDYLERLRELHPKLASTARSLRKRVEIEVDAHRSTLAVSEQLLEIAERAVRERSAVEYELRTRANDENQRLKTLEVEVFSLRAQDSEVRTHLGARVGETTAAAAARRTTELLQVEARRAREAEATRGER